MIVVRIRIHRGADDFRCNLLLTVASADVNACPDPSTALSLWKNKLLGFETAYWASSPWDVMRQGDSNIAYKAYDENFLFSYGQAAFLSIDLINGQIQDSVELQLRHEADFAWIETAYNAFDKNVTTIFIFANDGPPGNSQNAQFYRDLFMKIRSDYRDKNFVLVYRGDTSSKQQDKYKRINNLDVISVLGPPVQLTVNFAQGKRVITLSDSWQ